MADTAGLRIDVLGPLRVRMDGRPVEISTPRLRMLLVRLAVDVGRVVSVDRLVEDLWPGEPPRGAVGSLRSYLSNLRGHLGTPERPGSEVIVTQGRGYALQVPPEAVDLVRFEQLLAEARSAAGGGAPEDALERFDGALALWHGEALADVRDQPFAQPEITRLEELRLTAREDRCDVLLRAGRHGEAVADLEALVAAAPHRERPRAQLMLALYRSGRAADALRVHREYRRALGEELGLDPGPDIERLADDILRQRPELDLPRQPAPASSVPSAPAHVVGRVRERAVIDEAVRSALAGQGTAVLVAGEPGIGKTALLEELGDVARSAGLATHVGRCLEIDGAPALWPWRQIVQSVLDGLEPAALAAATEGPAAVVADLLQDRGPNRTPDVTDVDRARVLLYEGVITLLRRTAPSVVVLEDVHWADPSSLELLTELSARLPALGVAVAVSYRDVEPHGTPPLAAAVAAVARRPGTQTLELAGLENAEIAALLTALTGRTPEPEIVATVRTRTAGNPFFVRQLAALVADRADGDLDVPVPAGVRHVIEQRVALLGSEVRATLEAAAVLGGTVAPDVLAEVRGVARDAVMDHVDVAVAHGLLVATGEPAFDYRFVHSLVRETLDELLPPARRGRLHAAAGSALDRPGGGPAEQVAEHYWAAAGLVPTERTVDALRRAADAARRVLAYDEAEQYLRRALQLLDRHPDARTELAVRLQLVQTMTSRRGWTASEVEAVAGRVRDIVDEAGIGPDLIPLWWALWNHYFTRGELATADDLAEKLLRDAESHDSPACRVAGHVATAVMRLHRQGDASGALAELAAARQQEPASPPARLAAAPEHLSVVLRATEAVAHAVAGDQAAAARAVGEALAAARRVDAPFGEAFAHLQAGWIASLADDPATAHRHAEAALGLCDAHGFEHLADVIVPLHAWASGRQDGDLATQVTRAEEAIATMQKREHHQLLPQWLLLVADLARRAGDHDRAAAHVEEARRLARSSGDRLASRLPAS